MRLSALTLDDFGCFQGARLRDIDDELVVIGGPQRAGKTTFMQAIRQLRGGIARGDGLPPEADAYRIDAELAHDGAAYRLRLDRFADPHLSALDGAEPLTPDQLFDGIDRLEFQQLYTLSLRELQLLPPGIDDAEDLSKILLGAAYGEIAEVPELKGHFADEAYEIGLSRGDPTTKTSAFNDPYTKITEGIDALREANGQVDEYHELEADHQETLAEIESVEAELEDAKTELDRLRILQAEHDDVRRYQTLTRELEGVDLQAATAFPDTGVQRAEALAESFEAVVEAVGDARGTFEATVGAEEELAAYQATLLDHQSELETYEHELTGWEERVTALEEDADALRRGQEELEREVGDLHPEWDASLDHIADIDTSLLTADQVRTATEDLATATETHEATQRELEAKQRRHADLQDELETLDETEAGPEGRNALLYRFLGIAAVAALVGIGGTIAAGPAVGFAAALLVVLAGGYFLQSALADATTADVQPVRELRGQARALAGEIDTLEADVETASDEIAAAQETVDTVRETVGIPADVSPNGVAEFYEEVARLQEELTELAADERRHQDRRAELAAELDEVATVLSTIRSVDWREGEPVATGPELFSAIRTSVEHLELAVSLREAQAERRDVIAEVTALFDGWAAAPELPDEPADDVVRAGLRTFVEEGKDALEIAEKAAERDQLEERIAGRFEREAAKSAFRDRNDGDEAWLTVLERELDAYVDVGAIEDEIQETETRIEKLEDRKKTLRETEVDQRRTLESLKSDDDLYDAQARIDEGRTELERVGERYATYRIAEVMMDQLHDEFIEEVAGSLLDDAGQIFARITEEYTGIELAGDLDDLDFRALREEGPAHGRGELSRATAEQLFMAIRIAKIWQLDVELPVVLDDSMTNFDPQHSRRMLRTMEELTATNQVFVLTCHPELLDIIRENAETAQYWCLEEGQFTGPWNSPEPVTTVLHEGG